MVRNNKSVRPIDILLVDDSKGDVRLAIEALKDSKMVNEVQAVYDGVEAMAYLRREGKYANATRPDLVLLDLNMPKKDGREVLTEMKADPDLRCIPVVILTVSNAEEDVMKAYCLQAACFITKPVDLDQFIKVVNSIDNFWFSIVTFPPK